MGSQAGSWMELRGQQTPRSRLCQRSASLGPGHVLGPHSWAAVPLESDPILGTGLQPIKPGAPSSPHRQAAPAPTSMSPESVPSCSRVSSVLLQPGGQCPSCSRVSSVLLQPVGSAHLSAAACSQVRGRFPGMDAGHAGEGQSCGLGSPCSPILLPVLPTPGRSTVT